MLKSDLVNILMNQRSLSQRVAEEALEHIFDAMKAELVKGENIELRGFGSFHVKSYDGYTGRNPKTLQIIKVRPKRGVLFRTGKELRERLNNSLRNGETARGQEAGNAEENAA
jgi:integration host factor subunit beta